MGVSKTLNKVRQKYYWLQASTPAQNWCTQCYTCAASLGPRTKNRGPVRKESHRCSRALLTERPKKPIPPDRCGLFYNVAGSLRHSQSGGFGSGGRSGYQLLSLRSADKTLPLLQGNFRYLIMQDGVMASQLHVSVASHPEKQHPGHIVEETG